MIKITMVGSENGEVIIGEGKRFTQAAVELLKEMDNSFNASRDQMGAVFTRLGELCEPGVDEVHEWDFSNPEGAFKLTVTGEEED